MVRTLIAHLLTVLLFIFIGVFLLVVPKAVAQPEEELGFANSLPVSNSKKISELTPQQYLYLWHPDVAEEVDRIIQAESNWVVDAQNPHSSAGGLAQFLDSTWLETSRRMGLESLVGLPHKMDPITNINLAVWLYKTDGPRHWRASSHVHKIY